MAIRQKKNGLQVDVTVTVDGDKRRWRKTSDWSMREALAKEAEVRADLLAGRNPGARDKASSASEKLTLGKALDETWRRQWKGTSSAKKLMSPLRLLEERFGRETPLEDITSDMVDEFVHDLTSENLSASTVQKRLHPLSVVMNHYFPRGKIAKRPAIKLPKVKNNARKRIFADDEAAAMFKFFGRVYDQAKPRKAGTPSGQDFHDLTAILYDVGCRPSELYRCRRQDFRRGIVDLLFTKTEVPRSVPLTERAQEAVDRQLLRHRGTHPFSWCDENKLCNAWAEFRDWMGIDRQEDPDFVAYILRHACATRLYGKTRNLLVVKEWLGHKNLEITQRYAKLFPGELERARDVLQSGDADGDAVTRLVTQR